MTGLSPTAGFARRYRVAPALFALLAAVPVAYIGLRITAASRNIAFWDEFDSVLALLLRLDSGIGWQEFVARVFALDSEHRTVTSRLIVAAGFGLTGAVNFNVICAIGNGALVAMCALLVASVSSFEQRLRLGVVLAFGLFHLEHYEPFLWSGAAIDHFLVLLLAGGTFAGIAQGTRLGLAGAGLFALLATFTLAHGCAVWPLGAALLWSARRQRALLIWGGLATVALLVFFRGFHIDASHQLRDYSPSGFARLAQFWLALLGGPLTFGARALAPWFGLGLLALFGWVGVRGAWQRHPVVAAMAAFAAVSLGLIAFGRLEVSGPQIQSRYLVLGSLTWSLAVFLLIEQATSSSRPYRILAWSLPALVAFNVTATLQSAHDAAAFLWSRDYAAVRFKQYGEEGHAGPFRLHPRDGMAKTILRETTKRGIYSLPRFCVEASVPEAQPNPAMVTYVTDLTVSRYMIGFEGWAMFPERKSRPDSIHVVLRSNQSSHVFTTFGVARPDVAKAFQEPLWHHCGYNFVVARKWLPPEDFQVGFIITDGDRAEIKMTEHWVMLAPKVPESRPLATTR